MVDHDPIGLAAIPGWIAPVEAYFFADLLTFQQTIGVRGDILEIGVYAGKSLAVLADNADCSAIIAIDTFDRISVNEVRANLAHRSADIIFLEGRSADFRSHDLAARFPAGIRFASIDGSHDLGDVTHDIGVIEELGSSGLIVAIDDFLNPYDLGVNQAVNTYLSQERRLVPFAYVRGKIFLTDRDFAQRYRDRMLGAAKVGAVEGLDEHRARLASHPRLVMSQFYGHPVLAIW